MCYYLVHGYIKMNIQIYFCIFCAFISYFVFLVRFHFSSVSLLYWLLAFPFLYFPCWSMGYTYLTTCFSSKYRITVINYLCFCQKVQVILVDKRDLYLIYSRIKNKSIHSYMWKYELTYLIHNQLITRSSY